MAPLSITVWALGIIFVWWAIVLTALGLIGGAVVWLIRLVF